jgi:hypothetical protein
MSLSLSKCDWTEGVSAIVFALRGDFGLKLIAGSGFQQVLRLILRI